MAELEGLHVKITGDASGLVNETNKAENSIESLEQNLKDLQNTYKQWTSMTKNGDTYAEKLFGSNATNQVKRLADEIKLVQNELAKAKMGDGGLSGLSDALEEITKAFKGGSIKDLLKDLGKVNLAMLGVRGVFTAIRKAMSSYLSQNEELQARINGIWYALGSLLAPVLEFLVNLASKLLSLINAFVQGLGGAGISLKNMSNSAKEIKKSLAGIDEINNIGNDNSSGTGMVNPLGDVNTGTLDFIRNNAQMILDIILAIITAIIMLKGHLSLIQGLGVFVALQGVVELVKDLVNVFNDPSWENITRVLIDLGVIIAGLAIAFGAVTGGWAIALAGLSLLVLKYKNQIATFIVALVTFIKTKLTNFFANIKVDTKNLLNAMLQSIGSFVNKAIDAINDFFGKIRDLGNSLLELLGISSFKFEAIPHWSVPQLATGTNYVPHDMLAQIHEGEAVVPKQFNPNAFYGSNTAEQLNLLVSINEQLVELNRKDTDIVLDGDSVAKKVNNKITELNFRNGNKVFAIQR